MIRTCDVCGNEFNATYPRHTAKTCTPRCQAAKKKMRNNNWKRRWRKTNPEAHAKEQRIWRKKNPSAASAIQRRTYLKMDKRQSEWRAKNPDRLKEQRRRYRQKHKKELLAYNARWYSQNIEKMHLLHAKYRRRSSRERITLQQQLDLLSIKGFLESCLPPSSEPQPQK